MVYFPRIFLTTLLCTVQLSICWGDIPEKPQHSKSIVCYVATWAVFRSNFSFGIPDIDPTLCTHLVYAFAGLKNDTQDDIVSRSPYADLNENGGYDMYNRMTALKNTYPHLKVLLSMGGWNDGSINYSKLSSSNTGKRERFAANALRFIRRYNFDGLDIYWQYPGQRGGSVQDKDNFPKLLQEVKSVFQSKDLLLTVTTSGLRHHVDAGYDLAEIAHLVDWVNMLAFYYATPWGKRFGIHSPIDSDTEFNVEDMRFVPVSRTVPICLSGGCLSVSKSGRPFTNFVLLGSLQRNVHLLPPKYSVNMYTSRGVPHNKIVLGVPMHGFGFTNVNEPGSGDGIPGILNDDKGYLAFYEICNRIDNGWRVEWDNQSSTPIASKDNEKISYDNQDSVKAKARFVLDNHLRGVALWTLDVDDYKGVCNLPTYGAQENINKFPLLKAINAELSFLDKTKIDTPKLNVSVVEFEFS